MFIRRYIRYLVNKIKLSNIAIFDRSVSILPNSSFEGANRIGKDSVYGGNMGYGTYIGNNCNIQGNIGRFCSFGENCKTIFWRHPLTYPYVSTSPIFFSTRKQCGHSFADHQIFQEILSPPTFENDVWVGSNVTIIGSVHIGNGAVILTNSVVTKDVAPYQIVGGVPARPIKYRYKSEDIEFLIQSRWWDKSIDWIAKHWYLINNFEVFKEYWNTHYVNKE